MKEMTDKRNMKRRQKTTKKNRDAAQGRTAMKGEREDRVDGGDEKNEERRHGGRSEGDLDKVGMTCWEVCNRERNNLEMWKIF